MTRNFAITFLAILAGALAVALFATFARAHEAPTGWSYPLNCCSGIDCAEINAATVRETPDGYLVTLQAEDHIMLVVPATYLVPYGDGRIKDSPDGVYHVCISRQSIVRGEIQGGRLICLFVPPKGF